MKRTLKRGKNATPPRSKSGARTAVHAGSGLLEALQEQMATPWPSLFVCHRPRAHNPLVRLHWLNAAFIDDFKVYLAHFCPKALCEFEHGTPPAFTDFEPRYSDRETFISEVKRLVRRWPAMPPRFWTRRKNLGRFLPSVHEEELEFVVDPAVGFLNESPEEREERLSPGSVFCHRHGKTPMSDTSTVIADQREERGLQRHQHGDR